MSDLDAAANRLLKLSHGSFFRAAQAGNLAIDAVLADIHDVARAMLNAAPTPPTQPAVSPLAEPSEDPTLEEAINAVRESIVYGVERSARDWQGERAQDAAKRMATELLECFDNYLPAEYIASLRTRTQSPEGVREAALEPVRDALADYDRAVKWHSYRPHDVNREREQHEAAARLAETIRSLASKREG